MNVFPKSKELCLTLMNRVDHISIREIIDEFIQDTGLENEALNQEQLVRWAVDATEWLTYADNLKNKFILLNTQNGKVELPSDFCTLVQVAYRKMPNKKDKCTSIERVSQWVQHDYNSGLDIEINVRCNKCGVKECKCGNGVVEVDIDPIWRLNNPFHDYFGKMGRLDSFGKGEGGLDYSSEKFHIMRYAGSDLHAVNLHIPQCYNLNAQECDHRYSINQPYIQTDIRENGTEILLSYLGMPTDDLGDPMIPQTANTIDAIKFHLSYKYFMKKYHMTLETKFQSAYRNFELDRERAIELARSELKSLGYHELHAVLSSTFYGRHTSVGDKYEVYGNEKISHEQRWLN